MSLKLYGVPLSQPVRAVAWALLQKRIPFEFQLCVPGMKGKIGTLNPSFIEKSRGRTATVPLLEVTDEKDATFTITESPAILTYLCHRYGWDDWYPTTTLTSKEALELRTIIDSYMHWHHTYGTRRVALLAKPYLRPEIPKSEFDTEQIEKDVMETLTSLEEGWLSRVFVGTTTNDSSPEPVFIAGSSEATIADLLCYEEVAQASMSNLLPADRTKFPKLYNWMDRMAALPYHDEVHTALTTLGDLKVEDSPLPKRLGAATKAGMKAIQGAMAEAPVTSKL